MTNIILVGSGGCMREIVWQIQEKNKIHNIWRIAGYVDCQPPMNASGLKIGTQIIKYLGNDIFLMHQTQPVNVAICIGSPVLRKKLSKTYMKNPYIKFPNLILGNTKICNDVRMGMGCIISMDVRVSTNVKIGNFVFMNTASMVCHDGHIGDYVTLGPDVKLAGSVKIGECSNIGIGAKVIQGLTVGKNVTAGAGCVIVKNIADDCMVAGIPAQRL